MVKEIRQNSNKNIIKKEQKGMQAAVKSDILPISRFAINFRDIEDCIRPFDGNGKISMEMWVSEFEEIASIMYWDEFQKFVFMKKSLRGLAKLFISYEKLKNALFDEFRKTTNSAQLHKLLRERKNQKDESVQEYFLHMKYMASQRNVEEDALIQYVIDGITDSNINKVILYGSKNIRNFKDKYSNTSNAISLAKLREIAYQKKLTTPKATCEFYILTMT